MTIKKTRKENHHHNDQVRNKKKEREKQKFARESTPVIGKQNKTAGLSRNKKNTLG